MKIIITRYGPYRPAAAIGGGDIFIWSFFLDSDHFLMEDHFQMDDHFGTKVTVVDFMCYFSIPSPLKQFERYLSSFMADKCTFHINLPLGFDRMDTHIYLSLKTTNKKKNVILKNCSY